MLKVCTITQVSSEMEFHQKIVFDFDCAICQRHSVEIYTGTKLPINTKLIKQQSDVWLMKNAYFDNLCAFHQQLNVVTNEGV